MRAQQSNLTWPETYISFRPELMWGNTDLPEPSNIAGDIARNASIIVRRRLPNQTAVVPFSRCTAKAS